jgi:hypothetical protein
VHHLFTKLARCAVLQVCVPLWVQAASWQAVHERVGALRVLADQRDLAEAAAAAAKAFFRCSNQEPQLTREAVGAAPAGLWERVVLT